jgi:hypothetical protein
MRSRNVLILGLAVAVSAPAMAQQPPQPGQPRPGQQLPERRQAMQRQMQTRMQAGPAPELVLRLREELNLTEAQINRLEALRQEGVTAQRDRIAERLDLQSQLQAGRITREQVQERMRARAEAAQATPQPIGERVRAVLNDQQRLRLAELQVQQMQRQLAMQRGGRQALRGSPGRGVGPGQRPMMRGMMGPGGAADRPILRRMLERRGAQPPGPGAEI